MSSLILIVDDEEDVEPLFRQRFRRELSAGRFEMTFAQSAAEALRLMAEANSGSIMLVFSDINMPGMSGLELLPKVKAIRPEVPVIMLTAYGDEVTRATALEQGAETLLSKPVDFTALRVEIDLHLGMSA